MPQVYVATSSYDLELVKDQGQFFCLDMIADSGAEGIELRRELFDDRELSRLSEWTIPIKRRGLTTVYSAPVGLWTEDGTLNVNELSQIFKEAQALDASIIKMSLGHFQQSSDVRKLEYFLQTVSDGKLPILSVENDQTAWGGMLPPLEKFFNQCALHRIPVSMTFDIANWHWTGEDPVRAAERLAKHVVYIHCKQAACAENRKIAVPIEKSANAEWRKILALLPENVPRGIEFPIKGRGLAELTAQYVQLLSN